jgi:hypothetical protein
VLPAKRTVLTSLTLCLLLPLASCANSPLGDTLRRSLAADPRLESSPAATSSPDVANSSSSAVQLPANFPSQVPRYPNADLVAVIPGNSADGVTETRWRTTDAGDRIRQFYQESFQAENWKIASLAPSSNPASSDTAVQPLIAEGNDLRVKVAIAPNTDAQSSTEFTLAYELAPPTASPDTNPDSGGAIASGTSAPQPGDPNFVGPVLPPELANRPVDSATPSSSPSQFTDLAQAPEELRSYVEDLAKLGVLSRSSTRSATANPTAFKPNQTITRREFARWLVAANNRIYGDRPAQKIRLGTATAQSTFRDLPKTDPDFAAIQGLAEAGLIPSSLSGNPTAVTFRPDAPLARESLILWKTPVDLRQTLPNASIEAVQQTWGFQDAARIDPLALKAVLADYQNGDLSNIRRAFGYTTLFQPKKPVTRAEAAAVLWYFGTQGEGVSAQDALQPQPTPSPTPSPTP